MGRQFHIPDIGQLNILADWVIVEMTSTYQEIAKVEKHCYREWLLLGTLLMFQGTIV